MATQGRGHGTRHGRSGLARRFHPGRVAAIFPATILNEHPRLLRFPQQLRLITAGQRLDD